jgi:1,4-dihydroxy-6-naphthoate synthase
MLIRVGHSPDPDDAFMFYALSAGRVETGLYRFQHILQDIQTLNERATRAELEVSAISLAAYPSVQESYALMDLGASMGDGYGPMVVARRPMTVADLAGRTIAVPGTMTTAFLTLNLLLGPGRFAYKAVMFDTILAAVVAGQVDAGLIIHEGQLTYRDMGLERVVDLGAWWKQRTSLPLPLGGNIIRRNLGQAAIADVCRLIRQSIEYGLRHRPEALQYAMQYGRDLNASLADRFVGMYVNEYTLRYGPAGREAVRRLLSEAADAGLVAPVSDLEFVG